MALLPNLNGKLRAAYFLAGVVVAMWGLFGAVASWARITWLACGGLVLVFGIIGFCPFLWLFGMRGSPPPSSSSAS